MAFIDNYSTPGLGSGAGPLNILSNPANTSGGMARLFSNNPSLLTNPRRGRRHWALQSRFGRCFQRRGEGVSGSVGSGRGGRGGWSVGDTAPAVEACDGRDAAGGCLGVSAWTSLGTLFRGGA
jgi:hypothetical protein